MCGQHSTLKPFTTQSDRSISTLCSTFLWTIKRLNNKSYLGLDLGLNLTHFLQVRMNLYQLMDHLTLWTLMIYLLFFNVFLDFVHSHHNYLHILDWVECVLCVDSSKTIGRSTGGGERVPELAPSLGPNFFLYFHVVFGENWAK